MAACIHTTSKNYGKKKSLILKHCKNIVLNKTTIPKPKFSIEICVH